MGAATIDVQQPRGRQSQLPLSPALRARQAAQLSRRLAPRIQGRLQLVITDNRSVMISVQRDLKRRIYNVRLHHLFSDAPDSVLQTLARYVTQGDRESSHQLNLYIDQQEHLIRDPQPTAPEVRIQTRGKVHDLQQTFDALNERYFDGRLTCRITWGRNAAAGRQRRSVRVGCYVLELDLIRIHPGLDRSWVPEIYLQWVVFHEMLHAAGPIPVVNGRRRFHTAEFARQERTFEHYRSATEWERRNLAALLSI